MADVLPSFDGGWTLTTAGEVAVLPSGRKIGFTRVIIVKVGVGVIVLKDPQASTILQTHNIADGSMLQYDLKIDSYGLELDSIGGTSAVVTVFGHAVSA